MEEVIGLEQDRYNKVLLYSIGNCIQYLVVTYNVKEPQKEYMWCKNQLTNWLSFLCFKRQSYIGKHPSKVKKEEVIEEMSNKKLWHTEKHSKITEMYPYQ